MDLSKRQPHLPRHHARIFTATGLFFLVWSFTNTYVSMSRYGVDQGMYWWFCNLALFGTAIALLIKSKGCLIGWLSVACFTQVFWIIDNIWRLFTGDNLLGVVEFMYQPGLPMDEFVLSHYHYLTIPIAFVGLYFLPKGKSLAIALILLVNPLIFGVSYFAFPATQNINCIHEPCVPTLAYLRGPTYSILFWLAILAAQLLIGHGFEKLFHEERKKGQQRAALVGLALFLCCTLGITIWDIQYKQSLPTLKCTAPFEDKTITVGCKFTLDFEPSIMLLVYSAQNKTARPQICSTQMRVGTNPPLPLHENFLIQPYQKTDLNLTLSYPTEDTTLSLEATCQEALGRQLSHQ